MTKRQPNELEIIRSLLTPKVNELKLRKTAEWLNERMPKPFQRSHMSVKYWLDGVYKPDDVFLSGLKNFYPSDDERHQLAVAIMKLRGSNVSTWIDLDAPDGKKLLGVVKITTDDDGNLIHEGMG